MCIRYIVYKIVTVFKSIKINIGHEKFLFDNLLIWDFSTEFPLDFKALFYLGSQDWKIELYFEKILHLWTDISWTSMIFMGIARCDWHPISK